jgi:hypothetical protein
VQLGRTVVGLQDPAPGTYSFTLAPGSPRVTRIAHADDPPAVAISARVTGDGVSRVLRYDIAPRPDERVTFLDVGPQGAREIGTATGGRSGAITFTPAPGGREHTIQAVVEYAGIPVALAAPGAVQRPAVGRPIVGRAAAARTAKGRLVLARFRPPALRHAGAVRGLAARRAIPKTVAVSWRRARAAARYLVVLRLGDGSTRTVRVAGTRHGLRLRGVAPTLAGRVTVRAIGTDGVPGRAARVRFRATARPRTAQRPFRSR